MTFGSSIQHCATTVTTKNHLRLISEQHHLEFPDTIP